MKKSKSIRSRFAAWVILLALPMLRLEAFEIEPVEKWSGVFGESKVTFSFRVVADEPMDGTANWSYAANGRIMRRGQSPIKDGMISVELTTPLATDGVIVKTDLSVRVEGQKQDAANVEKTVWLFPKDPFFERKQWLAELKLSLFDPERKTADIFDRAEIPFEYLPSLGAVENVTDGIVVVGEGVSLKANRLLSETLATIAAKGVPVLLLAPADGVFALPGMDQSKLPSPNRLALRRSDVIRELDKTLDSDAWPPRGEILAASFTIKSESKEVVAEFSESKTGWSWLEMDFPGQSKLIVCGFGIMKHWDDGPTPRFLLARLFELLEKKTKETELQSDDSKENK